MIDYLATESQYAVHLRPLWDALPEGVRGTVATARKPRITDAVLVSSGSDLALAKRLGYKRIAYLEHGIGQPYGNLKGYPGGKDRAAVSLFLSPNETAAAADGAVYPGARIEIVGDPRLDTLPKREFTGIKCDPWGDLLAAIRGPRRTLESGPAAKGLCVAHAIADARLSAPGNDSQPGIGPRPSTTERDTSPADLRRPADQHSRDQMAMAALTSAMSTCTTDSGRTCPGRVISADRRLDLRWLSDGTLQRSFGESGTTESHSLQIPTTTFGSVSLAIPCTTAKAAIAAQAAQPVVCASFHWDAAGAKPWPLSALPHYRRVLPELAKRFPLIGHAHPKAARTLSPLYKRLGIEFVPDFDDVLRRADLYIADNTSTLYEFASTGRPVVVLNAPWFDRKVELGLRFWAAANVGVQVDEPDALPGTIDLALSNPVRAEVHREAALDIAYAFRHDAAQRAADAVVDWLGAVPAVKRQVVTAGPALKEVILVPRRADSGPRDVLWAWCKAWWEREQSHMPIFEGHHEAGLFNRSAAVNRAAALAGDWDVAVIIDSDVIVNPERVKEAVTLAHETGQMVLPHDMRKDLNQRGTDMVMSGFAGNWERFVHRRYPDMVSSVVVIPRRLWDEIGGFDETFAGWGYEDTAFAAAAQTFGGIIRMPGEIWHLYHPTAKEGRPGTPTWSLNSARGQRYRAAIGNREAIRALQAERPLPVTSTGIPPILHRVVPETPDPRAEAWWKRFGEMHPGWTLLTHRDPLVPSEWPLTSPKWRRCANGAQLADLVRLEALLRWGGIYVDQDVEPCRPLDPLLSLAAFAAWEDERCVPNAVMGATPDHPAIQACLDLALSRIPGDTWKAGPGVTTEILPGRKDVLLLPPGSFYGVHYRDPDRDRLMSTFSPQANPWAFVLHHYFGSWLAKRELVAV